MKHLKTRLLLTIIKFTHKITPDIIIITLKTLATIIDIIDLITDSIIDLTIDNITDIKGNITDTLDHITDTLDHITDTLDHIMDTDHITTIIKDIIINGTHSNGSRRNMRDLVTTKERTITMNKGKLKSINIIKECFTEFTTLKNKSNSNKTLKIKDGTRNTNHLKLKASYNKRNSREKISNITILAREIISEVKMKVTLRVSKFKEKVK